MTQPINLSQKGEVTRKNSHLSAGLCARQDSEKLTPHRPIAWLGRSLAGARIALSMALIFLALEPFAFGQKLHALLIADTDSNIRDSVSSDIKHLRQTLEAGLPAGRLKITEITGSDVTPNGITHQLLRLEIQANDSVLMFYSGHGGYDPDGGHFLSLTHGGRLYRSEVVKSITQPYTPRFWGIITDCCASFPPVSTRPYLGTGGQTTLLTHLFLETTGRVDITSSRPEQVSLGLSEMGGVFTWSLCQVLMENANRKLNWDEVFRLVRSETAQRSEQFMSNLREPHVHNGIEQRIQIPYSFRTMYGNDVNGTRLGLSSENRLITSVRPNSAAARAGLRPGMRVMQVNGYEIGSDRQAATAIYFSGRDASIDVLANGRRQSIEVRMPF